MMADIVILRISLFDVAPSDIKDVSVIYTFVGGVPVFERE
jgi:predicted amidohydrolase YtcJ